ncbi:MAG: ion channel [Thiotrichales bacterium]
MLMNLLYGLGAMLLCLFLQSLLLYASLRFYRNHRDHVNSPSIWSSLLVIKSVMMLLLLGNLAQIALWAGLFMMLGEFQQFDAAFYHSAVNFATLGYGDVVMSEKHKLLGPLEAVNGILMIGVSTAALMSAFQDSTRKTFKARQE